MSKPIISVENLSKRYHLGQIGATTLRESAERWLQRAKSVGRRAWGKEKSVNGYSPSAHSSPLLPLTSSLDDLWALRDVSFEVQPGEVLGIIGRNGAGKSTLLKVLSRITEPTCGRAIIRGRVASLLEVGTGFHPELTGRENIFLNGAILGMKKNEILRKYDEIVSFAEVERFIDTPVKRYSSGMYVRLAFAVAAHLEPEILIVDEVLAVGDAAFQKKCTGKMGDVAKQGRTVLFVSHNMGVVGEIAKRGIWLDCGNVRGDGEIANIIPEYLSNGESDGGYDVDLTCHQNRLPRMTSILRRASCRKNNGICSLDYLQSEDILIDVEYQAPRESSIAGLGFVVYTTEGVKVGGYNTYMAFAPPHHVPSAGKASFVMPARQFTPGGYRITFAVGSHQGVLADKVDSAMGFIVHPADIYGTGYLLTREDGVTAIDATASIQDADNYNRVSV